MQEKNSRLIFSVCMYSKKNRPIVLTYFTLYVDFPLKNVRKLSSWKSLFRHLVCEIEFQMDANFYTCIVSCIHPYYTPLFIWADGRSKYLKDGCGPHPHRQRQRERERERWCARVSKVHACVRRVCVYIM